MPLAGVVLLAVVLDQAVKWLVETRLPFQSVVPVVPMLAFYRTYNQGIAFSFLNGSSIWLLLVLTVCVVGFVVYLWRRTADDRWLSHLGYALIIGGAIGNMIDRALLGHVVDFILFHTVTWSFAVFNLADSFISVGAAAVILDEVFLASAGRRGRRPNEH
ncbi:MAG: signal peptidase II [Pararhizobium sp.]